MININAIEEEISKDNKNKEEDLLINKLSSIPASANILPIMNNNDNTINITEEIKDDKKKNDKLKEEEILKAKENGFILIGKTGVGKTSLLNLLFRDNVGKVGFSTKSETKESNFYCIKEKMNSEYIYFCVIDTPGLYDTDGIEADNNQKEDIKKLISKEKIKIKGLLFLSNFQNERFDSSEQDTLIQYNALFPLKEFWNRILLIFTHYYGDPDGDTKEQIKERANEILSNIFITMMNKVKDVSNPIKFTQMKQNYINIYSKVKNKKQIENNELIRSEIILEIKEFVKLNPMFSQLQHFHFEKYQIKPNDPYLYDCDLYIYLDANNNMIQKDFITKNKYPKSEEYIKEQKVKLNVVDCKINEEGNLVKNQRKKEGFKEIFKDFNGKIGSSLTILSIIGMICSGIFFPVTIPVYIPTLCYGVAGLKVAYDKQNTKEQEEINELLNNQNIHLINYFDDDY